MKDFIKKWLMLYGLASISATIIPALLNGYWESSIFSFQLLFALLIICLLQLFTEKIPVAMLWVSYLIDLGMTILLILFFGWIWNWYELSFMWIMFAMIIPAFIIGYFLGIVKVKRKVDIINRQIKCRREKMQQQREEKTDDC